MRLQRGPDDGTRRREAEPAHDRPPTNRPGGGLCHFHGWILGKLRLDTRGERRGQASEAAYQRQQCHGASGDQPRLGVFQSVLAQESVDAECREHRKEKGRDVQRHSGCSDLLHERHDGIPQPIERSGRAERHEKEKRGDSTRPQLDSLVSGPGESEDRKGNYREAEVFGVQFEAVATPIGASSAIGCLSHEVGKEQFGDVFPRNGVARCPFPATSDPFGARRIRQISKERHDLDRADSESDDDRTQHTTESEQSRLQRLVCRLSEGEVEREQAGRDEHVIQHLTLWTQQTQANREREDRIPFPPSLSHAQHETEKRQREQGGDEQFAVVAGVWVRRHQAGQLVCDAAHDRPDPGNFEAAEKQIGEQACQHVVQGKTEVHRGVRRQENAQPSGRIEDVAVHGAYER